MRSWSVVYSFVNGRHDLNKKPINEGRLDEKRKLVIVLGGGSTEAVNTNYLFK